MSVTPPIDMETFRDAIYTWFRDATGLETIWSQQSAPRPDYPYGTLLIMSGPTPASPTWEIRYSTDLGRAAGTEVEEEAVVPCTFSISCQSFVGMPDGRSPDNDAELYMDRALGSLALPSVRAFLRESNISVLRPGQVNNISSIIGESFVSRAGMDVLFGASLSMIEYIGYIKTVHGTSANLGIDEVFGDV